MKRHVNSHVLLSFNAKSTNVTAQLVVGVQLRSHVRVALAKIFHPCVRDLYPVLRLPFLLNSNRVIFDVLIGRQNSVFGALVHEKFHFKLFQIRHMFFCFVIASCFVVFKSLFAIRAIEVFVASHSRFLQEIQPDG